MSSLWPNRESSAIRLNLEAEMGWEITEEEISPEAAAGEIDTMTMDTFRPQG